MKTYKMIKCCSGFRARAMLAVFVLSVFVGSCAEDQRQGLGSGTFEATEVKISALLAGTVLKLDKREGELVQAGELVAEIDAEKLTLERELIAVQLEGVGLELELTEQRVSAAKIQLSNDRKRLERI